MRASFEWIRDYLPDWQGSPAEMADLLTFSGSEVEQVEAVGDDHALEVAVTSNRVDCLGHVGLAREVSVVARTPLRLPEVHLETSGGPTADATTVTVADPVGCPRYTATVIEGVRVGPSPGWLTRRLEAVGLRPVNNVVDVTNFVLLEANQPLHAFDLDRLAGAEIRVRRAAQGEPFTAINGRDYELSSDDLVIADGERPVALAGVMGGIDSEVGLATTRVLIEGAWFEPLGVRRTSRRHQLRSDSSHRFERGVDRVAVLEAAERAAALIVELGGGTVRRDPIDLGGPGVPAGPIDLRPARLEKVAGIPFEASLVERILTGLGCRVQAGGEGLSVTPPSWRADLTREIDLVEEVVRVHGLDHLPATIRFTVAPHRPPDLRNLREHLKDQMVAYGYLEVVTPDFLEEALPAEVAFLGDGPGLRVRNPVRAGEGALRRSLIPGLLRVRLHNQDVGNEGLCLFEAANLHFGGGADSVPPHLLALGFMTDGDYRDVRGVVESLLDHLGIEAVIQPSESPWLDPGARAVVRAGNRTLGQIGYPARDLLGFYGLRVRPACGELDLEALLDLRRERGVLPALPRFPMVVRDLAFVVDASRPYGDLDDAIRSLELPELAGVTFFDEFRGRQVGAGRKSLALRLVFRAPDRTLTSEEVDRDVEAILARTAERCGAVLRGP